MIKRIQTSVLILIIALFSAIAGGIPEETSSDRLRIVSLAPNVTEIVCALDCEDCLVGRTDQCNWPQSVISLPSVGDAWNINSEKVLALNPTLVLASYDIDSRLSSLLSKAGIRSAGEYFENTTDGTAQLITFIGAQLGKEAEAEEINRRMEADFDAIRESVRTLSRPTVYMVISYGSFDSTATGETFLNELIETSGGENIAADSRGWQYTKELLIQKDPEYILFVPSTGNPEKEIEDFTHTPPYSTLTAVKEGRVFPVEADRASRQGPRIVEAAKEIRAILHE